MVTLPSPRRIGVGAAALGLLLLCLPAGAPPLPEGAGATPFAWNQDSLWSGLEADFREARAAGCEAGSDQTIPALEDLSQAVAAVESRPLPADDARLDVVEQRLFAAASRVAACPTHAPAWAEQVRVLRRSLKDASRDWDPDDRTSRQRLYRLLYGARAATEEILLQAAPGTVPATLPGTDEPSASPSARVHGVRIHSGDLLLSRGGAPTSALIARGNDFPGNFSHVALARVTEEGEVSVVEAHIESGVGVFSLDDYLRDKKLRILVLRPRSDLPQLVAEPGLPHRVASEAVDEARAGHIAYDFAMDIADSETRFCSEVASAAYGSAGVTLWRGLSSMSGPGVTRWLAGFGVRHFTTQAPSDLEYDPQLRVVAEWRNPVTLFQDHVDNAVIDAMLGRADGGEELPASRAMLPVVRVAKGWSLLLNLVGRVGPVPEGMSAATALRVDGLRARHAAIKDRVLLSAAAFETEQGYRPPYWVLVGMAEEAAAGP